MDWDEWFRRALMLAFIVAVWVGVIGMVVAVTIGFARALGL